MLILDEPTSGVDPLARDRFWEALIDLSRDKGVTIFVSTHFMNEAERCDRIALMDSGRVLASGPPASLVRARGVRDARGRLHQLSRRGDGRASRRQGDRRGARRRNRAVPDPLKCEALGSARGDCSPIRSERPWSCCAIRSGSGSACSARRC